MKRAHANDDSFEDISLRFPDEDDDPTGQLIPTISDPVFSVSSWKPYTHNGVLNFPKRPRLSQVGCGPGLSLSHRNLKTIERARSSSLNYINYTQEIEVSHNMTASTDLLTAAPVIDNFFTDLMRPFLDRANPNDIIGVSIDHQEMAGNAFYITYTRKTSFDPQCYLNTLFRFAQSNRSALLEGPMTLSVSIISPNIGAGRQKAPTPIQKVWESKKSIVNIKNNNNLCFHMAFTLGKILVDDPDLPSRTSEWNRIRGKETQAHLLNRALDLFESVGLSTSRSFGSSDFQRVQDCFPAYQLLIVKRIQSTSKTISAPIFKGQYSSDQIILEFVDGSPGHFNLIKSIRGYYKQPQFCTFCWVGYQKSHVCLQTCSACYSSPPCRISLRKIQCESCHRVFFGKSCLRFHLEKKICVMKNFCLKCDRTFNRLEEDHNCLHFKCKLCSEVYAGSHHCCIKKLNLQDLQKQDKINQIDVCFDTESTLEAPDEKGYRVHKPVLIISHTHCNKCTDESGGKRGNCELCGQKENVFIGFDCILEFLHYLIGLGQIAEKVSSPGAYVQVYAHNFKGYDGRFILRELFKSYSPSIIMNGSKILRITWGNIKFIDSNSFFLMPLSKVAGAFAYEGDDQLIKYPFPHEFNTQENWEMNGGQGYKGPLPPIECYPINSMSDDEYEEFSKNYQRKQESGFIFNFRQEIIKYCRNDVEILVHAIHKFRKLFISVTQLDPTTRNFTLASIGHEVFRAHHLKFNSIGITPINGYIKTSGVSMIASSWLDYMEKTMKRKILREQRIGNYFADGFDQQRSVYEFLGCYWHGCDRPKCRFTSSSRDRLERQVHVVDGQKTITTPSQVKDRLRKKLRVYNNLNLTVHLMKECELFEEMHQSPEMKSYIESRLTFYSNLKKLGQDPIRASLAGGRTCNFSLWFDSSESGGRERLRYLDFTSLYPYVLKKYKYPIGHPVVILEDFDFSLDSYFGFITCRVQAPRRLKLPVLLIRVDGKLLDALCSLCATTRYSGSLCRHSPDQRSLTSTWTTIELKEALKRGYIIEQIYSVIHYPEEMKDKEPFADYIRMWLKIKTESSKLPDSCIFLGRVNRRALGEFITEYYVKEGVVIHEDEIRENPGLRSISKLMLNSFW